MASRDEFFCSTSEGKEYFLPIRIYGSREHGGNSVYWSHNPDENDVANCSIEERIRRFLIKRLLRREWYDIVQFWAVKRIAGSKCLLTTTHQPFGIDNVNKKYSFYRKECMRRNIDVSPEADESQLGPPGRAYRSGFLEICPEIRLYTVQEFPLRDHAFRCGLQEKKVVAIPVFELDSNHIVGVLEFLCHPYYIMPRPRDLETKLKEVGLRTYCKGSSSESKDQDKYSDNIIREIDKMFKEVAKTHPLALGLALAPCCKMYCLHCCGSGILDNPITVYTNQHMNDLYNFIEKYNIPRGMGVSGRAFASGKSCFCRDIRNLSLLEYPYALYARHSGLTYSVATCLQSIQDKNSNFLVLECFLLPGCYSTEYIGLLSESLLQKIKEHLSSYRVADEDFPGEELDPEICDSLTHNESPLSFSVTPTCGCDSDDGVDCILDNNEAVVDFFFPNKLSFNDEESSDHALVLWSHVVGKCDGVEEHIKHVFKTLSVKPHDMDLVQFWAPRMADRSFLTTLDQPFALGRSIGKRSIRKVCCLYRKECMTRKIYVDDEGNIGPAGRAFKNGVVESSQDVRLYTIEEFPLRDDAILCGIKYVIWLPVFDLIRNGTVGVLEIVIGELPEVENYFICLTRELKKMGLRIDYVHPQPGHIGESQSHAGIKNMFEAISASHPIHFARALIPSQGDYCFTNTSLRCFKEEAYYINPICWEMDKAEVDRFMRAGRFPYSQDRYGVAGKALASRRSCFCMNTCNLVITDYPLAHYAKRWGFSYSVAICLQNTYFVDTICVLEFFMLPGNFNSKDIRVLLDSLLISVKHHLPPDFEILSEDVPGEPFFLEIGNPVENGETGRVAERENICRAESSARQLERNKFHISLDELKHHFGKPLDKVAEELGVSRSTLKRIRKSYGIQRWPSHKKNKANQSIFMKGNVNHIEEDIMASSSRTDSVRPVLSNQTSTLSTCDIQIDDQHRTMCEVVKFVTIKASYGNDVLLKFQLNIRSRLEDLENEVAQRLKVQAGRCNMKYEDEDGDWISITIDKDLEGCLQTILARGQTTIRISVHIN